jgi:hypothetical protein
MTLAIVETSAVTGGVGTRADVHVAGALDPHQRAARRRGVPGHPRSGTHVCWAGWAGSGWCAWPIEGTGSYGTGLARHIAAAGVRVVEVGRSDRQDRRRQGKSDLLDAVSAARAAQSGRGAEGPGWLGGGDPRVNGRPGTAPPRTAPAGLGDPGHQMDHLAHDRGTARYNGHLDSARELLDGRHSRVR